MIGGHRSGSSLRSFVALTALVLSIVIVVPGGPKAAGASIVCGETWSSVPSAAEVRQPKAIVALAPDDAWIVGSRGIDDGVVTTGAEHWDGERWTLVPTPNVGTNGENALSDVDGDAGAGLWAVGYSTGGDAEGGGNFKTLVQRWNGSAWSIVPSPNAGTSKESSALTAIDVLPSGKAWAVGYHRSGTRRNTLITRWNGRAWSIVPSPNTGAAGNALTGVAAVHGTKIWAVGWQMGPEGIRSLILRWDGAAWSPSPAPHVGSGDNVLTAVSVVSGSDVWAVGYAVDGATHRPLTLHFDGSSWSSVAAPSSGPGVTVLRGVGAASGGVWAVGARYRPDTNTFGAWSQRWDGSDWVSVPNAALSNEASSELHAVAAVPGSDQIWAAGRVAVVETICPTSAAAPAQASSGGVSPDDPPPSLARVATLPAGQTVASAPVPVEAHDMAGPAGIAQITKTRGAEIADLTGDGLPDIFLGRHQKPARLYRNDGSGVFTEILEGAFGPTDRHGCDSADVDGNGALDIYCAVGAARGTIAKRNELYLQGANGSFVDLAWQLGVLEPYARGRSGTFVDADGLGGPDLFVANFPDRADGLPSPNRLFINDGTSFRAAPEFGIEREVDSGGAAGGNPLVGDLDLDGWQDIVMDTSIGLVVYRNQQGTGFQEVQHQIGLGIDPVDLTLADVDGDSDLDVVSVTGGALSIYDNDGGSFGKVFSTKIQLGKAVAAGDVNGDARPDIYVMTGSTSSGENAPDRVFLNDGTGTMFTSMSGIPSVVTGKADSVWPLDHDGNGLTDFLALNGKVGTGGPVQLIAFYPTS